MKEEANREETIDCLCESVIRLTLVSTMIAIDGEESAQCLFFMSCLQMYKGSVPKLGAKRNEWTTLHSLEEYISGCCCLVLQGNPAASLKHISRLLSPGTVFDGDEETDPFLSLNHCVTPYI